MATDERVGKKFLMVYGDANLLWEVVKIEHGYATVVSEDPPVVIDGVTYEGDYDGVEQVMTTATLDGHLAWGDAVKEIWGAQR